MTGLVGEETMDEDERYAKGMAARRNVLGNAWVDRAEASKTDFNAEFQAMINRSPWHVRAALTEGGFSPDDIKEIILQQTAYCGAPAGNHAFKEAGAIVSSMARTG
jgi:alkylhydroperoxidase/carboxymuconolactone decarboxylase family protein YurZ